MTRTIPALILLLLFPSFSFTKQVATFPGGSLRLHGIVFRPEGKGRVQCGPMTCLVSSKRLAKRYR